MKKLLLLLILLLSSSNLLAETQQEPKNSIDPPSINISGRLFGGLLRFPDTEGAHWVELDFEGENFTLNVFEDVYEGTYESNGNIVTLFVEGGEVGKLYFQNDGPTLKANMNGIFDLWIFEWPEDLKKFEVPKNQVIDNIVKNETYDCIKLIETTEGKLGIRGTVKFTPDKSYWYFPGSLMEGKYKKERAYDISGSEIIFTNEIGNIYNNGNFIEINIGEDFISDGWKQKTSTYLIK